MSGESAMQDGLFPDPLGLRLRAAREQAGLSIEQVGAKLRLPTAIIEAMEREDWSRLGAAIYVRSYVGGYLRLLGLPDALLSQAVAAEAPPPLVTLATRSRMRHAFDTTLRNAVYLVMTAVLVVPIVLVARHYQARDRVQDLALDAAVPAIPPVDPGATDAGSLPSAVATAPAATPASGGEASALPPRTPALDTPAAHEPVMASMAPFTPAGSGGLVLTFHDESWIDVVGPGGLRVERGLVPAGAERRYAPGDVVHVTLGNADGVDVEHSGRAVDLTPFRAANVARFAVSSDGAPAPATN